MVIEFFSSERKHSLYLITIISLDGFYCFDSVCWVSIETLLENPVKSLKFCWNSVAFKSTPPYLDAQWGLCVARTEEIRDWIQTLDWAQRFCLQFSLHANEPISIAHLSARGLSLFFCLPASVLKLSPSAHGLCMVINIECDIIVFLAACWWAILRSPSWATTKSRRRSRTRGRKWSDCHTQTLGMKQSGVMPRLTRFKMRPNEQPENPLRMNIRLLWIQHGCKHVRLHQSLYHAENCSWSITGMCVRVCFF